MSYFRKTYEIVGFALDGAVYCLDCAGAGVELKEDRVVLGDANDMTCDGCFERLDGEEVTEPSEPSEPPYRWSFRIRYVDPDVSGSDPEQVVGDVIRVTFFDGEDEIDTLDFSDGHELVEEIEYWVFEENPED